MSAKLYLHTTQQNAVVRYDLNVLVIKEKAGIILYIPYCQQNPPQDRSVTDG